MFPPPAVIKTEVFARVPDSLRKKGQTAEWLKAQKRGASMDSFLEGPSFDREGNLYVVDIPYGRIFRVSPSGDFHLVAEYDGEPNGLKFHKDGRAFIADHKNGIMVLDPETGHVEPYLDRPRLERFRGVNDLFFATSGDLYFTDQGQSGLHDPTGCLYRLRANGRLERLLNNVPSPNGVVLDLEEHSVLLAVTRGNCVWRIPMLVDGAPSKVGLFLQLSGGFGPDGLALDLDGNLAVCHPGLGIVWLFSPSGVPLYRVESCAGKVVTNCAYGGPGRKFLYITEAETGTVLRAELPVAGRPMYLAAGQ
jgi:gluconolactonase